ncbi:formate dehydrogenase accessory sulfurtransferase FdhD [Betaproteobacteria bacterium PRO7]|jgi:FdhD protein|nr:formate dehydrogenase accessory sulfurtransferase FdhD [Betaproteobacteria bacterium PRO7]GIL06827.1 MAG: sulfurtransferase FdhD [Betaproteobacteria bacterium]
MGAIDPVPGSPESADGEALAAGDAVEPRVVERRSGRAQVAVAADLAQELPIAFEYNGISHAVMLATPADLHDFAVGFSLSEGIATSGQCYGVDVQRNAAGITLAIEIAAEAFVQLKARRRTLAGRTGCGICGTESLDQVLRPLPDLSGIALQVTPSALARAHAGLEAVQPLQRATGAAHVAVWCARDGAVVVAREDVGRHNALDKLIGALARARTDPRDGFALVTSRASVEMVQKSATAGIAVLAAVSAPTALAVRTAESCGQTLIGFARGAAFNVYTRPDRLSTG